MKVLDAMTLVECMFSDSRELREFSRTQFDLRYGIGESEKLSEDLRKNGNTERIPGFSGCRKGRMAAAARAAREGGSINLSTEAIMSLYHSGDEVLEGHAKEQAVHTFDGFVHYLMNRVYPTFSAGYCEDLTSCGCAGILSAMINYDGSTAFTTYSRPYILHEMSQFVSNMKDGHNTTYFAAVQKKIKAAANALESRGLPVNAASVSDMSGLSEKIAGRELELLQKTDTCVPFDAENPENPHTDDFAENSILKHDLSNAIRHLTEAEKILLDQYFIQNLSVKRISDLSGKSSWFVKKSIRNLVWKLGKYMK